MDDGRMADALLLASIGGEDLWNKVQKRFMKKEPKPYMKVVAALMQKDLGSLVEGRPLASWRETLAMLCTYAPRGQWAELAQALAAKLAAAGQTAPATLCYICAGNADQATAMWCSSYKAGEGKRHSVELLQSVMEKALVMLKATGSRTTSPNLSTVVNEYVEMLVAQGQLSVAMK
eukprot:6447497-Pyramimonas_sp.AAC.1